MAPCDRVPGAGGWGQLSHLLRRLEWIEDLLPGRDVLAGPGEAVPVDDRVLARSLDLRDAERLAEDQVAVANRVLVAVERAHGRTGGAVALLVVLAAVTGTSEATGGEHLDQRDVL